jgi:hypothetical protein
MTGANTPPRWRRLLHTGAAGEIGGVLRPVLRDAAERLRLHDLRPLSPEAPGEEAVQGVSGDMEIWSFRIPGAA